MLSLFLFSSFDGGCVALGSVAPSWVFKALLARQAPKAIARPIMVPRSIAKRTSFRIPGYYNGERWWCQIQGAIVCRCVRMVKSSRMDITWLGHASFRIKGKGASIVTDPFDFKTVGLKFPRVEADIVTVSHHHFDHDQVQVVGGDPFVVDGPGEYEVKGVSIFGIQTYHDNKNGAERGTNTVYSIVIDGIRVCHLGDLGHKLSSEQLGEIGNVDVLFVPVGGFYTIDSVEASEAILVIDPKVVIPMHYKVLGLNPEVFGKLEGLENFVKEIGLEPTKVDKYTITQDKLPEERQVVVLERKS